MESEMNERFKQLAEQAGLLQFVNGMTRYRQQHKLEKFAELIVRECAKVADGGWADPGHQIKQHFGVE
jgi:hypothetical protein